MEVLATLVEKFSYFLSFYHLIIKVIEINPSFSFENSLQLFRIH